MKTKLTWFVSALLVCGLLAGNSFGRGGGRAGGGGGARGGGFSVGGGISRPGPSMGAGRSPSMSRPAPRPAAPAARPSARPATPAARPSGPVAGGTRPGGSVATRPSGGAVGRPGGAGAGGVGAGARPTQSQLSNFLNLPASPATRPAGGATSTTPGGREVIQGDRGTVIKGDSGAIAVGGGSRTGPGGNTIGGAGAIAVGQGPRGATVAKGKGAVGISNGMSSRVAVRGGAAVRGPGGNTIAGGYGGAFVNGQFVGGAAWQTVNGNFTRWNSFTPGWRAQYPGAWWPGKWAGRAAWATAAWVTAEAYCGCSGDGMYYDYGEGGVNYDDGTVYYGDEAVATAEEYYDQASDIAAAGETAANEEWMSLGVFSVISEGQTQSDKTAQLAVNKEGIIRGNLHDQLADKVAQISGSVDKNTQRVAMRIEGNDSVIVETGLYNLTNDEVPVLVHFDKDRQESRLLVRLEPPADAGAEK